MSSQQRRRTTRNDARQHRIAINHRSLLATLLAMAGLVQFGFCVSLAAGAAPDFEFGKDFLSTLGTSDNSVITMLSVRADTVFNTSIVTLGSCLILFFAFAFDFRSEASPVLMVFVLAGISSACGLIGIGMTPFDAFFIEHMLCLVWWLLSMIVMAVAGLPVLGVGEFSTVVSVLTAWGLVALTVFFMLSVQTRAAPAWQALVVIVACSWLLLMCLHVSRAAIYQVVAIRRGHDRAAQHYIQLLEKNGLAGLSDRSPGRWDPTKNSEDQTT